MAYRVVGGKEEWYICIYPVILLLLPAGGVIYLYTYFEFGAECTSVGLYRMCM